MREITYDLHGALRVRLRGLSPLAVRAFNTPCSYFESPSGGAPADLDVEIGDFEPDLTGCVNVDHKFHLRRDYIYFRGSDKRLSWQAEIRGLDRAPGSPLRVRCSFPLKNRFRYPWGLFPDYVLHLHVIGPLMEYLLWKKGYYLLHSAAVAKDGKACLVAGRGGAHKTTFVMELMRRGWSLLGDDMVIVREGRVFAYPTIVDQMEYLMRSRDTEHMDFLGHLGLFLFLGRRPRRRLPVAASAEIAAVNLVFTKETEDPKLRAGWDGEALCASLATNHLMERNTYVGFKYSTTAFLDAYAFAFPEAGLRAYEGDLASALKRGLSGLPFRVLEVPRRWDPRALDLLSLPGK